MMNEQLKHRMKDLYQRMQDEYAALAGEYGFNCEGCADNCCTHRFNHHTIAEFEYLQEGIAELDRRDPELIDKIITRASVVTDTYEKEIMIGEIMRLMCPLNFEGKCVLYDYRPMICRMHGLPHSFTMPNGVVQEGGGCHRFEELHALGKRLDRTAHYNGLAMIERDLRMQSGNRQRYKKTTAQMLIDMLEFFEHGEDGEGG